MKVGRERESARAREREGDGGGGEREAAHSVPPITLVTFY